MKKPALIAVGIGLVTFVAIFGGAMVLRNTAPVLYPLGTGWGAFVVASVPFFAAGLTTGRWSGERSVSIRAFLGAILGLLVVTCILAWLYLEGADLPLWMITGMYLASIAICAVAAALGSPRGANKTMESTR